jgi:26S proteasome regulatory subunit N11
VFLLQNLLELAKSYQKAVQEEDKNPPEKQAIANVGRLDPKRHLEVDVQSLMASNILQTLSAMLDTVVF